jgi:pyruvate formate lyase activating enzyme
MITCTCCGKNPAARHIGICLSCIRARERADTLAFHDDPVRESCGLPRTPPRTPGGRQCRLCAHECLLGEGESGFCGLRTNREGKIVSLVPHRSALACAYVDPLPTNCCAAWFCPGTDEPGYNLAVFFYGCNFNCLFCQNWSHKKIHTALELTEDELAGRARASSVRCICFFGGSPEPQFPFALRAARRIFRECGSSTHICWEWNGAGNPRLVEIAARLSMETGGMVKFDLKAFHPVLHRALCGTGNERTLENFRRVAEIARGTDMLTATTLLVPYYVDAREVEAIASFIASIDDDIPYSLLVFHPDYLMADLPVTPRVQVEDCVDAARRHLNRVHVGNLHLLRQGGRH